jgi:hypothetical protein
MAVMSGEVQGKVKLHRIGSEHPVSQQSSRQSICSLVDHASTSDMNDMQAQGGFHLQFPEAKDLGE